jgi:hypothetical protein
MALPKTIFDSDGNVKDYEKSFPLLLAHAKEGDRIAQSLVGYCYLNGLGVGKSRLQARRWLRDAAAQGDVDAMSNLGLMFEIGDGSPPNRRVAPTLGSRKRRPRFAAGDGVTASTSGEICLAFRGIRSVHADVAGFGWTDGMALFVAALVLFVTTELLFRRRR